MRQFTVSPQEFPYSYVGPLQTLPGISGPPPDVTPALLQLCHPSPDLSGPITRTR